MHPEGLDRRENELVCSGNLFSLGAPASRGEKGGLSLWSVVVIVLWLPQGKNTPHSSRAVSVLLFRGLEREIYVVLKKTYI